MFGAAGTRRLRDRVPYAGRNSRRPHSPNILPCPVFGVLHALAGSPCVCRQFLPYVGWAAAYLCPARLGCAAARLHPFMPRSTPEEELAGFYGSVAQ